jgi:benzoyl-CoA 2,3-dioxygenase component A
MTAALQSTKQHLIDPQMCIRCNTCEEVCPVNAITHDDNNYVVRAETCESCMKCVTECPTGAVDHWHVVARPYTIEEQVSWQELPPPGEVLGADTADMHVEALDDDVGALIAEAHKGHGGVARPPVSASKPTINLYNRKNPAKATIVGNFRLTSPETEHDIRHLILDFGATPFPVLEGQSVGITPPGTDAAGAPHKMRLYSIASPRDGEKEGTNNIGFTVKRVPGGLCSNYFCDLPKGATVEVSGPFGATFLMPNDPLANIVMICTGTGSAPFRGFIARRRRVAPQGPGKLMMFFGARRPEELPYFGPLQKLPKSFLDWHLAFSRVPGQPRRYVQDAIGQEEKAVIGLLREPATHLYVCGLRAMEGGVEEALGALCSRSSPDWPTLRTEMQATGRYHVETY